MLKAPSPEGMRPHWGKHCVSVILHSVLLFHAETFSGVYTEDCVVCSFSLRNRREYNPMCQLGLFAIGCDFLLREFRIASKNSQGTNLVLTQNTTCIFVATTAFTTLDVVKLVLVMFSSWGAKHIVYHLCLSVSAWIVIRYCLFLTMVVFRYSGSATWD